MFKLKPITEKAWLVLADEGLERIALLSEQRTNYVLISKDAKTTFKSREEVNGFFSEDVFNNVMEDLSEPDVEYFIKGYPVDFNKPFEADSEDKISELPMYTKTATSDVTYVAGYFCLDFPKNWMPAYCPKLATLDKYGYKGPYKTEREMKFQLAKLRKCRK